MYKAVLVGGTPWGFRLEDGPEIPGSSNHRVQIAKINASSKAQSQGIEIGDIVHSVNGRSVAGLSSSKVMQMVRSSGDILSLELFRSSHSFDNSDIYSSDFSSKDSNYNISSSSLSTLSATSGLNSSLSSLTLGKSSYEDDVTYQPPSTFGQTRLKPYRPVSFDLSKEIVPSSAENLKSNAAKAFPSHSKQDSDVTSENLKNKTTAFGNGRPNEHPTFSVKAQETDNSSQCWWNSDASQSQDSVASRKYQTSYSNFSQDAEPVLNGSTSDRSSRLPVVQNPTITLLKKKRAEGQTLRSLSTDDELSNEDKVSSSWFSSRQTSTNSDVSNNKNSSSTSYNAYLENDLHKSTKADEDKHYLNGFHKTEDTHSRLGVTTIKAADDNNDRLNRQSEGISNRLTSGIDNKGNQNSTEKWNQYSTEKWNQYHDEKSSGNTQLNNKDSGSRVFEPAENDVKSDKRVVKYEGIGPVDENSGVPIATRSSLNQNSQKEWYRYMYKSMHKSEQPLESNYVFPGEDDAYNKDRTRRKSAYERTYTIRKATQDEKYSSTPSLADNEAESYGPPSSVTTTTVKGSKPSSSSLANADAKNSHPSASATGSPDTKCSRLYSVSKTNADMRTSRHSTSSPADTVKTGQSSAPTSPRKKSESWTPAQFKYENQPYRVQPRSIEDYEPGRSSVLLSERNQFISSFGNGRESAKSRGREEDSTFGLDRRPFWKSTSAIDQDSAGVGEKETMRPTEVGVSRLNARMPQAAFSTSMPKSSANVWKKETNSLRPLLPSEEKNGPQLSRSYTSYNSVLDKSNHQTAEALDTGPIQSSQNSLRNRKPPEGSSGCIRISMKDVNGPISSATVLHTFRAQSPSDLSISEGDTVYVFHQVDDNWYEGECKGKVGKFPVSFVKIKTLSEEEDFSEVSTSSQGQGRALYDFTAQTSLELSFKKNEELTLISRINRDWLEGRIGSRTGFVPANYIQIIKEPNFPSSPKKVLSPKAVQETGNPSLQSSSAPSKSGFSSSTLSQQPSSGVGSNSYTGGQSTRTKNAGHQGSGSVALPLQQSRSFAEVPEAKSSRPNLSASNQPFTNGRSFQSGIGERECLPSRGRHDNIPSESTSDTRVVAERNHSMHDFSSRPVQQQSSHAPSNSYSAGVGKSVLFETGAAPPTHKTLSATNNSFQEGSSNSFGNSRYLAIYAYKPKRADELEMNKGDVVYVMEKYDDGWFVGMSERTKKLGTFPGNYVEEL